MTPVRRSAPSAAEIVFWLTAAMVMLNAKSLDELTGVQALALPIMIALAACHLLLASLVLRLSWGKVLGTPGLLIAAALASYLVLGAASSIETGAGGWRYAMRYGYVLLGVVATAVGAAAVLRRMGAEGLALGLFPLFGVASALVLASPWLPEMPILETDLSPIESARPAGFFGDPNGAGFAGCAAVALALPALGVRRIRAPALLVLALGAAAAIVSLSRAAIVTLWVVCLVFAALSSSGLRSRLLVGALGLAGLAGAVFAILAAWRIPFLSFNLAKRMTFDNDSGENRAYLLEIALSRVADSPLLGNGFGGFHSMQRLDGITCYAIGGYGSCGTHNFLLTMAGEAGIVPPILFLLFLAAAVRARLKSGPSLAGDAAMGWAVVLTGEMMTKHSALIGAPWNAFLIGAICAAAVHAERRSAQRRALQGAGI